jgi:hypothetical protein
MAGFFIITRAGTSKTVGAREVPSSITSALKKIHAYLSMTEISLSSPKEYLV